MIKHVGTKLGDGEGFCWEKPVKISGFRGWKMAKNPVGILCVEKRVQQTGEEVKREVLMLEGGVDGCRESLLGPDADDSLEEFGGSDEEGANVV